MIESSGNYTSTMKTFNLNPRTPNYSDGEGKIQHSDPPVRIKDKVQLPHLRMGYVEDPVTKNFTRTYLGDCVVRQMGEHSPISVNVVPDSSVNVGVSVYFGKDTDTEDTANLQRNPVKMVRAAIYTGANTSELRWEPVRLMSISTTRTTANRIRVISSASTGARTDVRTH